MRRWPLLHLTYFEALGLARTESLPAHASMHCLEQSKAAHPEESLGSLSRSCSSYTSNLHSVALILLHSVVRIPALNTAPEQGTRLRTLSCPDLLQCTLTPSGLWLKFHPLPCLAVQLDLPAILQREIVSARLIFCCRAFSSTGWLLKKTCYNCSCTCLDTLQCISTLPHLEISYPQTSTLLLAENITSHLLYIGYRCLPHINDQRSIAGDGKDSGNLWWCLCFAGRARSDAKW